MNLLVIRHGIAEDADEFQSTGQPDDARPLTSEGIAEMYRGARGLLRLVPTLDLIASSPLVRAQQTAAIVAEEYGMQIGETTEALTPDAPVAEFTRWVAAHEHKDVIAVVGHEPHLSTLITWLVAGLDDSRVELKKGGACLLEFSGIPRGGKAKLLWLVKPSTLRQIGKDK